MLQPGKIRVFANERVTSRSISQVSANKKAFMQGLLMWFALAIPSTFTNSMLRHLQSKLSLYMRTRLTRYTQDLYLSSAPDIRYYRVAHDAGLEGVDQYELILRFDTFNQLTDDITFTDISLATSSRSPMLSQHSSE